MGMEHLCKILVKLVLLPSLVTVSNESGCKTTALITDMNQPISKYRKFIEVLAAIDILNGSSDYRLLEVTNCLGSLYFVLQISAKIRAQLLISSVLSSGKAAKFYK